MTRWSFASILVCRPPEIILWIKESTSPVFDVPDLVGPHAGHLAC